MSPLIILLIIFILLANFGLVIFSMSRASFFRAARGRDVITVSPESVRRHAALFWLIRGTNALLAVVVTAFLCLIGVCFFLVLITKTISIFLPPGHVTSNHHDAILQSILFILAPLVIAVPFVRYSQMGRDMWQSVNTDNLGVFVFLFAYLIAHDFYYLLPLELPKSINDHLWIIFQSREGDHGAYRFLWSVIVFFLFRNLIKAYLIRAFDLNPPVPPQNTDLSEPIGPDIPFDPFVPLKNPPYHRLQ